MAAAARAAASRQRCSTHICCRHSICWNAANCRRSTHPAGDRVHQLLLLTLLGLPSYDCIQGCLQLGEVDVSNVSPSGCTASAAPAAPATIAQLHCCRHCWCCCCRGIPAETQVLPGHRRSQLMPARALPLRHWHQHGGSWVCLEGDGRYCRRCCCPGCRWLQLEGPHPAAAAHHKQHCHARRRIALHRHTQLREGHGLVKLQRAVQGAAAFSTAGRGKHDLYALLACLDSDPQAAPRLRSVKTAGACCCRCLRSCRGPQVGYLPRRHARPTSSAAPAAAAAAAVLACTAAACPQSFQQTLQHKTPVRACGTRAAAGADTRPCTAAGTPLAPPSSSLQVHIWMPGRSSSAQKGVSQKVQVQKVTAAVHLLSPHPPNGRPALSPTWSQAQQPEQGGRRALARRLEAAGSPASGQKEASM